MPTYLSLPGTSGNYASAPDSPALSITGDLDLRIRLAMDDWTPSAFASLFGKYVNASRDYLIQMDTIGRINFIRGDGATGLQAAVATDVNGVTDGLSKWVRVTHRVSDNRIQFFLSDDGSSWSQLGANVTMAAITPGDGTAALSIGAHNAGASSLWAGKFYRAEVLSGIDGTVVASPNFTNIKPGTTSFQDTQGNTWTIHGTAAIAGSLRSHTYQKLQLLAG